MNTGNLNNSCILITDHYLSKINGISIFSKIFIKNYLGLKYSSIIVVEASSLNISFINKSNNMNVSDVYVNAHYSSSDLLIRNLDKLTNLSNDFYLVDDFNKYLISHGWIKFNFRNHYYWYFYFLKNFFRSKNLNHMNFYNDIIFISEEIDSFRHLDYKFYKKTNPNTINFNFKSFYIQDVILSSKSNNNHQFINYEPYILIISNMDFVKNIFSIFYNNFINVIKNENSIDNVVILTPKKSNFFYKILVFLCRIYKFTIVNDNKLKFYLLKNCNCLYIASLKEYYPLVSMEAMAFNKKIYSLYKITSLNSYTNYKFFKN